MFTIRPFADNAADYAALSALIGAIWPDRAVAVVALQHFDQARRAGHFFQRYLLSSAGAPVGYCECGEPADSYRPGKYAFDIGVLPGWRGRGLGAALYDHLVGEVSQRPLPLTMLACRTREDRAETVHFLQKRGFEQVMRSPIAVLDVAQFDFAQVAGAVAQVTESGLQLVSLAELPALDPHWQERVYELDWECTLDEPLPDTPTKMPFAHYAGEVFGNPDFLPEAWFVAIDHGRYVGMTATNRNATNPQQLDTIFTGVVRSHRRRGIAKALKGLAIDYAHRHGYQVIKTDNEEHNPMFQINLALGFQPEPALLFFQKVFPM